MRSNRGVTLMIMLMTVLMLAIMTGLIVRAATNTYEKMKIEKFKSNMKAIQKAVDLAVEEDPDKCKTLGRAMTSTYKTRLQLIIDTEGDNIETTEDDKNDANVRLFTADDIKSTFNIDGTQGSFIINFAKREVLHYSGLKVDGVTHYTDKGW